MRYIAIALVLLGIPAFLRAQAVRGVVVDQTQGAPIRGALVSLVGDGGEQVAEVLTDSAGRYLLRAPGPGTYRLLVERVGYAHATTAPLALATGQTLAYPLETRAERVQIDALVVKGERRCTVRPTGGAGTAALWEQARTGLRSSDQSSRQFPYQYTIRHRTRLLDASTLVTKSESQRTTTGLYRTPFVSVPVETLEERGFVEFFPDSTLFHAPDASVLLSDFFLETHCFRVEPEDPEHRGMAGLAFEPTRSVRRPDVEGVLWLDASTAALRSLEYHYVHLPRELSSDEIGGRVEFEQLASGAWIVDRWRIRMPAIDQGLRMPGMMGVRRSGVQTLGEEAGEVIALRSPDGASVQLGTLGAVVGMVYDSTHAAPLVGARVVLSGTTRTTSTDSLGRFTIPAVSDGAYSLTFSHPRLDSLRFSPAPVLVIVTPPDTLRRNLAIPTMQTVLTAGCDAGAEEGVGAIAGFIRGVDGSIVPGVPLVARWQAPGASGDTISTVVVSDPWGVYRLCTLPTRIPVRISAAGSAPESITLASGERVLHDIRLELAAVAIDQPEQVPGAAGVRGRLLDATTQRPIVGAVVRFGRGIPDQKTDGAGEFSIAAVPSGSYGLEFSQVEYGIGTSQLVVPSSGVVEVELSIPRRTVLLTPLEVTAERVLPGELNARSRGRRLDIVTRAEIEKLMGRARNIGDLVRQLPGMRVSSGSNGQVCIQSSNAPGAGGALGGATARSPTECAPVQIIVDDVPMAGSTTAAGMIPVSSVESIIFLKPTEAMTRYGFLGERGVLLVYTRGNGPTVGRRE